MRNTIKSNSVQQIKESIKRNLPFCVSVVKRVRLWWYYTSPLKARLLKERFRELYHARGWGGESVSGPGADSIQTVIISEEIPKLIQELGVKVLLDAPCGDFNWMSRLKLPITQYIGVDIVPEIIQKNQEQYGQTGREFIVKDIVRDDLPKADMILCRDCFVHLPYGDIFAAIRNLKKSQSKYLFTTTYVNLKRNGEILAGDWRPINLQISPFNFPLPIKVIDEKCSEHRGIYADKRLALWKLEDLPDKFERRLSLVSLPRFY